MARTYTTAQRNLVKAAAYNLHWKVEVMSNAGAWQDFGGLGGLDWRDKAVWRDSIDNPTMEGTISFIRESGVLSLAPLISGAANTINNPGGSYTPALEGGRGVRISVCYVASGVTPLSTDYVEVFVGLISTPDWGGRDANAINCVIRDLGALLLTKWAHTEKTYGTDAGLSLETAIQNILDDNIESKFAAFSTGSNGINGSTGAITLYTPVASGINVNKFAFPVGSVLTGIRSLAAEMGWDVKFRYDAAGNFRLTLFNPRATSTPIDSFDGNEYFEIPRFAIPDDDVRNYLDLYYTDKTSGQQTFVTKTNAASITKYGEKYHRITLGSLSPVNTAALANALAANIDSDLALPYSVQQMQTSFAWFIATNDTYTFQPNGKLYDTAQNLAVMGFEHTLQGHDGTSVVDCRAQVAGLYKNWILRGSGTNGIAPVIVSIVPVGFTATGLDVQFTGDGNAGSWRMVAQVGSAPSLATIQAASVVAGRSPLVSFTGTFNVGDRIYIGAIAYRDSAGTVSPSQVGTVQVVKGSNGLGAPPVVSIDEVGAKTRTTATLTIRGANGAGSLGTLNWRYSVDGDQTAASWTTPSTTALPQTINVTRSNWADKTVLVRVTQADGQFQDAEYMVAARLDAVNTGTGAVVRGWGFDDGKYAIAANDTGGTQLLSTGVDSLSRPVNQALLKVSSANADTMDSVPEGGTYGKSRLARLNAGNPIIDFADAANLNKNVDNLADGATYYRTNANQRDGGGRGYTALDSLARFKRGNPFDDANYGAVASNAAGTALPSSVYDAVYGQGISSAFFRTLHTLDNAADRATYGRPLLARLSAGKPLIDFSEAIHVNKTVDYLGDGTTYARTTVGRVAQLTDTGLADTALIGGQGALATALSGGRLLSDTIDQNLDVNWTLQNTSASYVTSAVGGGIQGPRVARIAPAIAGQAQPTNLASKRLIPFNPNKLYRLVVRLAQTTAPATGSVLTYVGLIGFLGDGTAANANGGNLYILVAGQVLPSGMTEYACWVKGATTPYATTTASGSGTYENPYSLNVNTTRVQVIAYLNYPNPSYTGTPVVSLDYIQVWEYDEEGAGRIAPTITTGGNIKRGRAWDDGNYGVIATNAAGTLLGTVGDSAGRAVSAMFSKTSDTLDGAADGATYGRPLLSRLSAGKPLIDFSEAIHVNKNVDYLGDGTTYARPLAARLSAGKPWIDFSEAIHANKNTDNIADATGSPLGGGKRGFLTIDSANRVKRGNGFDDGNYAAAAVNGAGTQLHGNVTDSGGSRAVNTMLAKINSAQPDTQDGVPTGATYRAIGLTEAHLNLAPFPLASSTSYTVPTTGYQYPIAQWGLAVGDVVSMSGLITLPNTTGSANTYFYLQCVNASSVVFAETDALAPSLTTTAEQYCKTEGFQIPAGTVSIIVGCYTSRTDSPAARRLMLHKGPRAVPFIDTPMRLNFHTADNLIDGVNSPIAGGRAAFPAITSGGNVKRGRAFDDSSYASRATDVQGHMLHVNVMDSNSRAIYDKFSMSAHTADNIGNGSTSRVLPYSVIDLSNYLQTGVGGGALVAGQKASLVGAGGAIQFREEHQYLPGYASFGYGIGTQSIVSGVAGATFGSVLQVAGQGGGLHPARIPFNPTMLYRARVRVRVTVDATSGSVPPQFYAHLFEIDTSGNPVGGNGIPAGWGIASAISMTVANGWVLFESWFKGNAAGTGAGSGAVVGTARTPNTLSYNTVTIAPCFITSYSGSNSTFQVDYFEIVGYDEDGQARTYTAIDVGGTNLRSGTGIITGTQGRALAGGKIHDTTPLNGASRSFTGNVTNPPTINVTGGHSYVPTSVWGTAAQADANGGGSSAPTATAQIDECYAYNQSISGYQVRARLRQVGGTPTSQSNAFPGTALTSVGAYAQVASASAPSNNDSYSASYSYSFNQNGGLNASSISVTISFDYYNGTSWVSLATSVYSTSDVGTKYGGNGYSLVSGSDVLSGSVSGRISSSLFRLVIQTVSSSGIGTQTLSLSPGNLTYTTASGDQWTSKTPSGSGVTATVDVVGAN